MTEVENMPNGRYILSPRTEVSIEIVGRWLSWRGVKTFKNPCDAWVYQAMIGELQPDWIIECGTYHGGSALFLADMMDLYKIAGRIVTIDITRHGQPPDHPRIHYLLGSSTDPKVVGQVRGMISGTVLAILDSDHSGDNVFQELAAYAPMVTQGSYVIIEDTMITRGGSGPAHGILKWLETDPPFDLDRSLEVFGVTNNHCGFWKRR